MARRIPKPESPRDGMLIHPPRPAADPFADVVCIQFWNAEVDVRSTTNEPRRLRALLGLLVATLIENPSLLDTIAGTKRRQDAA